MSAHTQLHLIYGSSLWFHGWSMFYMKHFSYTNPRIEKAQILSFNLVAPLKKNTKKATAHTIFPFHLLVTNTVITCVIKGRMMFAYNAIISKSENRI